MKALQKFLARNGVKTIQPLFREAENTIQQTIRIARNGSVFDADKCVVVTPDSDQALASADLMYLVCDRRYN